MGADMAPISMYAEVPLAAHLCARGLRHLRHEFLVRLVDLFARQRAVGSAIGQRERHGFLALAHTLGVAVHVEQVHALEQLAARALPCTA